uniref:Uncharacterized protein n=1 Tax=Sphaerodactylus townsendi TaxID=933632 RepID=A0ACB8EI61_9SAUR
MPSKHISVPKPKMAAMYADSPDVYTKSLCNVQLMREKIQKDRNLLYTVGFKDSRLSLGWDDTSNSCFRCLGIKKINYFICKPSSWFQEVTERFPGNFSMPW